MNLDANRNTFESPNAAHHGHYVAHVVPPRLLLAVYGALLVLTIVTVSVTRVNFGPANIWVALGIAVLKAALVALFFMHLRWDSPFNGVILICALLFVAIFIGIALLDSREYRPNLEAPNTITPPTVISPS